MLINQCKLCLCTSELQVSHVIGRSVFRNILKNAGKNYVLRPIIKENKIIRTNDQWALPLLCRGCESLLNSKYENYSLWVLKNKQKKVSHFETKNSLIISNVDQYRLKLYVLSIYWRAAHSSHEAYRAMEINEGIDELLRKVLMGEVRLPSEYLHVKISKIIDLSNGFSAEDLKGMIVSPFIRIINEKLSICLIFEGYFFEIFFDELSIFERSINGVLKDKKRIVRIPKVDIFSIPELVKNMIEIIGIHRNT